MSLVYLKPLLPHGFCLIASLCISFLFYAISMCADCVPFIQTAEEIVGWEDRGLSRKVKKEKNLTDMDNSVAIAGGGGMGGIKGDTW